MNPDYRLFTQIVDHGSLSGAAREIGLSPAMVSKRLARLEARLGATLVIRTTRRLELTAAGARFYDDITTVLAAADAAEAQVSGHTILPTGSLKISAPTSFGRLHIAPYLGRFLDAYPAVDLSLNLADCFDDIIGDRIDLAVRITSTITAGFGAVRLGTSRRILCASPVYIARYGAPQTVQQLSSHRLLAADGQLPWRLMNAQGRSVVVDGTSLVRTNSSELIRELAVGGVGIALRSLWDIGADMAANRLVAILPDHLGSVDVGIYAVTPPRTQPHPAAQAFTTFLQDLYTPKPSW